MARNIDTCAEHLMACHSADDLAEWVECNQTCFACNEDYASAKAAVIQIFHVAEEAAAEAFDD